MSLTPIAATYGVTVSAADLLAPDKVAVRFVVVWTCTFLWPTRNETELFPAGTTIFDGTVAANVFELSRLTGNPPGGAGPLIETVPVTTVVAFPFTAVGEIAKLTRVGG